MKREGRTGGEREDGTSAGGAVELARGAEIRRRERESVHRRALLVGIAVSAALHAAVILFSGGLDISVRPHAPGARGRFPSAPLRAVELRESPAPVGRITPPAPPRFLGEEEPEAGSAGSPGEEGAEEDARLTNAERLRPRTGDPRLWRDFVLRPPHGADGDRGARPTRAERALYAAVAAYLDSARVSEEARRRLRDWTTGEGDERWGISPEGIHLGGVTIPVPWGQLFSVRPGGASDDRRELRELSEIRLQEALREVEEVMDERREAMRERRRTRAGEEEEDEADGEAAESAPDTTAARSADPRLGGERRPAAGDIGTLLALPGRP